MASYVPDSNIISYILSKDVRVVPRLDELFARSDKVVICPVVFFEIRRGLLWKGAARKLREFELLMLYLVWDEFQADDWERASTLWAESARLGAAKTDADILIAAHALRLGATLVTDNEDHFRHLGVPVENWCRP